MIDLTHDDTRPPYGAALAVAALVLLGYGLTLAPTVTFWDAGEFIATMRILGIPHPPGTPLFVLLGHVWGALVPLGEFAFRTNLMSAVFGALGAGCMFLVAHESLRPLAAGLDVASGRLLRVGGGAAAALAGAFTFTMWQNSIETEVYAIATFQIAAISWLCMRWRARRGDPHAARHLLLILYLAGLAIGNHLLALLAGPAVAAFLWATLTERPERDAARRRAEWAQAAVVAGLWVLLIGTGLGSTTLMILGGICFAAAAAFAVSAGQAGFAAAALAIAAIGVTPYLYLYIRSAQNPMINEAAPATWDALLAVIRREQYPPRTPFDDPTEFSGPDNPGRSLRIVWLQLLNYFQYFDWQWANGLGSLAGGAGAALRTAVTLLFIALGIQGSVAQRRADRPAWWLFFGLFAVTGLGLMAYMNFRPGYSLSQGYEWFPNPEDHEVRDRDYFFVVSFVVWGLWAGMGLAAFAGRLLGRRGAAARPLAAAVLLVALVPVALNWRAATRRGPDRTLAADAAYNLLNSVPPYGILFTYGDNDTFPLWWAQEVEGIRRDVTVVCLALTNTDWYIRQLRDMPVRPFDQASAPAVWRGRAQPRPTWPLHTMTDAEVDQAMFAQLVQQPVEVPVGPLRAPVPANSVLGPSDFASYRILQQNIGRRPILWAITSGREFAGLGAHVIQQGLAYRLESAPIDTASMALDMRRLAGAPLDVPLTERLVWETYRYGPLPGADLSRLESTSESFATTLALPFTQLALAHEGRGDLARAIRSLERAASLSTNPAITVALQEMRLRGSGTAPPPGTGETGGR